MLTTCLFIRTFFRVFIKGSPAGDPRPKVIGYRYIVTSLNMEDRILKATSVILTFCFY